jgi:hypothetical protein
MLARYRFLRKKNQFFLFLINWFLLNLLRRVKQQVEENTRELVKGCIKDILNIEEDVPFHVADRLCKRRDGRPRSIIATFEHMEDRDRVLDR